jgi:transposase
MRAYSQDLRERAVAAWLSGDETQAEVAERFGISKSTLEKWSYQQRDTGSCAPKPYVRGPARTLAGCEAVIRASVKQQPDLTLAELCERVQAAQGVSASPSMMCRALQQLALVRKKSRSTTASATRHA